jgi:uncharacterized protein (TIGR03000 family)
MRSAFLLFGLASALSLAAGDTARAGPGHGGGHAAAGSHFGGGHVGGAAHSGGGRGGSHFGGGVAGHGAWGHAGRYGYGSGRWGHGYGYGPAFGFGNGYPYGAYYGGYPYGTDLDFGPPVGADWSDDFGQAPMYGDVPPAESGAAPAAAQPVTLTILLPKSDAAVSLDGTATTLRGTKRDFQSPPLLPGVNYHYKVTAKWTENGQPVEQTQDVPVTAGQAVTVDFRGQTR